MSLTHHIKIARRFQKSIRIDTDIHDVGALEGFICPPSSRDVLMGMARQLKDAGHGAFTWTGPYGSGKSSLVVALCAALSGQKKTRDAASRVLGDDTFKTLTSVMPPKAQGWHCVAIVGRRARLADIIGEALESKGLARKSKSWTDASVLQALKFLLARDAKTHGGIVLIIDEMGKALEGAAHDGHDIYLLQQLAELSSRSDRRLVLVGILHQAFDEYAQKLARESRDEWAKIQGRFVDLVVNASGDEQLELLSRALETTGKPQPHHSATEPVARLSGTLDGIRRRTTLLGRCWPLHPITAALLGPLARRRFGQNQRSLFAFLNSAEPEGFHDFVSDAKSGDFYNPDRLWDYLRINLEPSILASPDGHRWAIGVDAIERSKASGASTLEISLLKTVIVIDLFRGRSGLIASPELLQHCGSETAKPKEIERALGALASRSCIVFRRHSGSYSLFAGSDFDIEDALARAKPSAASINLEQLRELAGLQPILAKRHYHTTGAIRWFNLDLIRLHDLEASLTAEPAARAAGRFVIVIPTSGETTAKARALCAAIAAKAPSNLVIGISDHAWHVLELAREFIALSTIHENRPELRGDAVARREVLARLNETQARLERELQRMTGAALWFRQGSEPCRLAATELNTVASSISDELYAKAPRILNELLNRDFPSSNAVKAQRDLMKRMLENEGEERLGLKGWPAEAGLLESLLLKTGLYREGPDGWRLIGPNGRHDPYSLFPLWQDALKELKSRKKTAISLADIYARWRKPPFGVKEGLMPVIALSLYLAQRDNIAVYRQGVFQPAMTDLDVDMLTSDAAQIQFRWIDLNEDAQQLLKGIAAFAVSVDPEGPAKSGNPLDVARSLIAAFDRLPAWTKRTKSITPAAQKLGGLLRYANDPNRLLFEDVHALTDKSKANPVKQTIALFTQAFLELQDAYPAMLHDLERTLFEELEVRDGKPHAIRERAANLHQSTGDLRLKAFIQRLATYSGTGADMEGIASLAIDKKPSDWVDGDLTEARRRLGELAHDFKRHEETTRVAGRPDTRHRMAVIVPLDGASRAMHTEFVINAHDTGDINAIIDKLDATLQRASATKKNIILAALAQLSARYMEPVNARKSGKQRTG